jgi:hypothetical protein
MSRLCHAFSALLILTSSAVLAEESSLSLASNGASQFTIVRPADASPSRVYAADGIRHPGLRALGRCDFRSIHRGKNDVR